MAGPRKLFCIVSPMIFRMTANTTCNDYAGYDLEMLFMSASLIDHSAVFEPTLTKNGSLNKDKCVHVYVKNKFEKSGPVALEIIPLNPSTNAPFFSWLRNSFNYLESILFVNPLFLLPCSHTHTHTHIYIYTWCDFFCRLFAVVGCMLSFKIHPEMFLCTSIYSD